jgi:hypothetical protein
MITKKLECKYTIHHFTRMKWMWLTFNAQIYFIKGLSISGDKFNMHT